MRRSCLWQIISTQLMEAVSERISGVDEELEM